MREAGVGSVKWALKSVTYFDHSTHRFVAGDIEIDGERIGAVRPPGASTLETAIDGRDYVCTPGLVRPHADRSAIECEAGLWLRAGITTAGTLCDTATQCIVAARQAPQRLVTRLTLNALAHARSRDCCPRTQARACELRALERIDALVRRNGGRLALAIRCAPIDSAFDLVYARNVASKTQLALGFELSDSAHAAQAFRERFYASETHLLGFLQLLHPGAIVWASSQLSVRDIDLLIQSGAVMAGPNAGPMTAPRRRPPSTAAVEPALWAPRICSMLGMQSTGGDADAFVDAATIRAATALGEFRCGRIAPDMYADLCLFQTPRYPQTAAGSEAFIDLFESTQPAAVVMAGSLAADSVFSPELGCADHPMREHHAASLTILLAPQA